MTSDTDPKIAVDDVGKVYGEVPGEQVVALEDVSFEVGEGEFFTIIGPSGCGKSTMLRILAELISPTAGTFSIRTENGANPTNAMVFQEDALFPWRTVQKNVEFGLEMRGVSKQERASIAEEYLAKVGLEEFDDVYPHQLSGGMRQRVNIARAFANDAEVLLMDEPLGALDAQTRTILQQELLRIWEEEGKTVVYVTHSLDEAILMSDRIAIMTSRPGRVKSIHEVDIDRPRSMATRNSEAFNRLFNVLWDSLEEEVQASIELEWGSVHEQ